MTKNMEKSKSRSNLGVRSKPARQQATSGDASQPLKMVKNQNGGDVNTSDQTQNRLSVKPGKIDSISGPLVIAVDVEGLKLYDMVSVGYAKLMGEVIELRDNRAWVQVYEETSGLSVNEPVISLQKPLSVQLGPGMLTRFYDGIQRPLDTIFELSGTFIQKGISVPPLNQEKAWQFTAAKKVGDQVVAGDIIGQVPETSLITHYVMVPPGVEGKIIKIADGKYQIDQTVAVVVDDQQKEVPLKMYQYWPIRQGRPYQKKLQSNVPLTTGQRVLDTFFPILKGGTAATPGPFGSGKTVTQQQLAKWCDAQIIIYIGCGERGNEMTDVLKEFPHLKDPKSGKPLMERTVLIANTSNMPIAAREASIYTGITIAEYYRDMGYDVALMADSTSRWAEALREISGRLEEMPGEEGYPAYLAGRIAQFYERAGVVLCAGGGQSSEREEIKTEDSKQDQTAAKSSRPKKSTQLTKSRQGSVTVVGAVSPPGGDLSEPVSQSSLRVTKVYWALDSSLAYARHYPAIHWLQSYSLYSEEVDDYNRNNFDYEYPELRRKFMGMLQEEAKLQEIIRIVGMDSLSNQERILLETTKSLREDYLQQNAFDEVDTYTSKDKQLAMLRAIWGFYEACLGFAERNSERLVSDVLDMELKNELAKMKYVSEQELDKIVSLPKQFHDEVRRIEQAGEDGEPEKPPLHMSISHLDTDIDQANGGE